MIIEQGKPKLLLFGGTGTIGQAIKDKYQKNGWNVVVVGRSQQKDDIAFIVWDPCESDASDEVLESLKKQGKFDAVCWAQGMNLNDDVFSYEVSSHMEMYKANVVYVLNSLNFILKHSLVNKPAKFCVLSSIWQEISRQNKLSYAVTKSAIKGLVLSACNDLAREGHLINAVLPGALETPMTRANLSSPQIQAIEASTQFGRLANLEDVSNAVYSLCSEMNTGVTGNFITVDLGFSHVRNI